MTDHDDFFDRLIDREQLRTYLESELGPAEEFEVERHRAGQSNETLFVTWGDRELVLRRPPPGETADTAHDVCREYTVVDALQETAVQVPTTVAAAEDHPATDSDFYLMEREDGIVVRESEPAQFQDPSHRRDVGTELIETLVAIHDVDVEAVGLEAFGHPEGYTQRQVDRWRSQYEWAFEVTADDRPVPGVGEVTAWLEANVPTDHPQTLVHGDYKLDNISVETVGGRDASPNERAGGAREQPPAINAVFDWELSTLGDPFTDLGWFLTFWPETTAETEIFGAPGGYEFQLSPGYHSRGELVDYYESLSGRSFDDERFYRVLSVYKIGALSEMFYRRYLEGNADNETYPKMESRTPAMIDWARRLLEGEELE
ncbi:phosphotransferase family protein [Salinadaptatus halalkaliphilus]|uniref:Phosphotransferase family protein n=1 Tax=Salinadaptatus halalkaliphilus TaxID=2419781 RepID=A0A4S3TP03_9EURY|nr:phosphotransferase family protein [Salinadaptatus halalkaliphilus]THE66011.1 phosphotransferase family protein [Salinadaptatus halalkaliphilus]